MFFSFQSKTRKKASLKLYHAAVAQARQPSFYSGMQVPDTVDGRFEMLSLHVFLIVNRLNRVPRIGRGMAQSLFDCMFVDMDRSARERGIGDLGVPKQMKRMMKGFNGRCVAYATGLMGPDPAGLRQALTRNVYGTLKRIEPVAVAELEGYVRRCEAFLLSQPDAALTGGAVEFPMEFNEEFNDEQADTESVDAGMVA